MDYFHDARHFSLSRGDWAMIFCGLGLLLGLFFLDYAEDCRQVRQDTLRLHILANSDEPGDQAVKLLVRDALLAESESAFAGAGSLEEARRTARDWLPRWEETANRVLVENGRAPTARASLVEDMYFETRVYDGGYLLPAGRYQALRVTLGEGAGHNWWCVMYPQLCVPAARPHDGAEAREIRRLTDAPLYQPRLKVVEWAEALGERLRGGR